MSLSKFCAKCAGIFEGDYISPDVLQHDLIDTKNIEHRPWDFFEGKQEWKVRLDSVPCQEIPVLYLHHNIQDLADSADSCVFCAMIWERLSIEEFLTYSLSLAGIEKKDIVGIPVIQPKESTYTGMFTFGLLYVVWSGHNWKVRALHTFNGFKAINVANQENRAIWNPVFDRQQSFSRIRHWLESLVRASAFGSHLPTRLLHCQPSSVPGSTPTVKLVNTIDLSPSTRYVALTHRWGTVQPLMLLKALEDAFCSNIPFVSIPATFQDAIRLTNDIGIEYIWIDSLCIIQDSKDDWQAEAARMASVYSQAYVTISATAAQDSAAGLKEQTSMLGYPCEITPSWTGFENEIPYGPVRIIIRSAFCDEILAKPLFRRGWTFQEWILSPATIHVARDQLWWTSASNMKSQGYAANETCEGYNFDVDRNHIHTMAPGSLYAIANESTEAPPVWHNLLQEYMSRDLTFESDRLVAFAGIATLYQRFAQIPPGSYLAGIWRQVLLQDLLWTIANGRKVSPPQLYRSPSWSWASVEPAQNWTGKFSIGSKPVNDDLVPCEEPWSAVATVLEASIETVGSEFGPVLGGHLVLHGPLIKTRLGMVMIDLSGRLTVEQAAEFVPGGRLRYVRNYVSIPDQAGVAKARVQNNMKVTMAQLDTAPREVDEEIDIYLAVIYCHIDLSGDPIAHSLALVRSSDKGEYRRIGYVETSQDILDCWKESRDFGVFEALTDEDEYLSLGDRPGYYNYRIV
ncbi:heterokaryon incompatibility protein-domain-containing protein [Fusarium flagelliforme]|uniref:Heterokaryon incompatibility domain-containing protein n=1 Tax=Fusarium flagelliforme TaxID=2675880 RepID=A0A395MHH5_9HYPO|nr:heterokaryon incompatibility protein-domain-containing protein [Fusarium flagelliforme]KAH7193652.1 heterokaryon incompatibility protein-domain-containing protein [Fusarium flagelliforme]RFN47220.1 hypothetical protein FIE12Z_8504 [Fusarium flagelliforme]